MERPIVVFGLGDLARLLGVYFSEDGGREVAAYTAHSTPELPAEWMDRPVIPFEKIQEEYPPQRFEMLVAVGYSRVNQARAEVYRTCKSKGYRLAGYHCSRSSTWRDLKLGDNCVFLEGNLIQPFVTIGSNVLIWSGCFIGHDSIIEDHCFIGSQASINGHVRIGAGSFIGANSTIRERVTIGAGTVIGAGALIVKDTAPGSVHRGIACGPTDVSPQSL